MRYQLTRALFRVKQKDAQSDVDYDAFMRCSLDDERRHVVKIYCFDDTQRAVVFYSDGEIELMDILDFTCSYKAE